MHAGAAWMRWPSIRFGKEAPMRRSLAAFALCLCALPSLAKEGAPEEKERDPVVGCWINKARLGDGSTFGIELKAGGMAEGWTEIRNANTGGIEVIQDKNSTMRVTHWRRVDATHIELTEVSEGNHTKSVDKVRY